VWGGLASIDACGACVGGTTGPSACTQDCSGVWGGTAAIDRCGTCVGGTTGTVACTQDCAGAWGGTAQVDACNRCTGGTSGREACTAGACRLGAGETVQGLLDNAACALVELPPGSFHGPLRVRAGRTVEVRGAARDRTFLSGGGQVFWVEPGASLRLAALAIRGSSGIAGAAVYNAGAAVLDDVAVTDNVASILGAIVNEGAMEIRASVVSGNRIPDASTYGMGAGVYSSGTLRVVGTAITGNRADVFGDGYGGGICNDGGSVVVEDSDISGNVLASTFRTTGGMEGAGVFSYAGTLELVRTRVHHNRAETLGNDAHGGGISAWGGVVRISPESDISWNALRADYDAFGAGVYVEGRARLEMDGVRVEGNVARAGVNVGGAAVHAKQASVSLAGNELLSNRLEALPSDEPYPYPVAAGGGVVSVSEGTLSLTGGRVAGNVVAVTGSVRGGLLRVSELAYPSEADEAIVLDGVDIADNVIATAGRIEGGLVSAVGTLRLTGCDVHGNTVTSTGNYDAAGGLVHYYERRSISEEPVPVPREVVVDGTRIAGNTVNAGTYGISGGLVYVYAEDAGAVAPVFTRAVLVGNSVSSPGGWVRGGLVHLDEPRRARFSDSVLSGNVVDTGAAPPDAFDATSIQGGVIRHTFTGSSTVVGDGGLVLERSDLSRNRVGAAVGTDRASGGVLYVYAPWHYGPTAFTAALTNVTIAENVVRAAAPVDGGVLHVFNRSGAEVVFELDNATVARNDVAGPLGSVLDLGYPAPDYVPARVRLRNAILAVNSAALGDCPLSGPLSSTASAGYNLLGDVSACAATALATDLVGSDPLLGVYGEHGGAVPSLPIVAGSPAVDGGDPAGCVDGAGAPLATDGRGLPRPVGTRCDIGAFEAQEP
jgi:hypothetical protein